jgi:hypothetical protein
MAMDSLQELGVTSAIGRAVIQIVRQSGVLRRKPGPAKQAVKKPVRRSRRVDVDAESSGPPISQ